MERRAIISAVAVAVVLLAVIVLGQTFMNIKDTNTYLLVAGGGLITYGIISGRVTEFSAGPLKTKLKDLANKEVPYGRYVPTDYQRRQRNAEGREDGNERTCRTPTDIEPAGNCTHADDREAQYYDSSMLRDSWTCSDI